MSNFAEKSRTRPLRSQDTPTSVHICPYVCPQGCAFSCQGEKKGTNRLSIFAHPLAPFDPLLVSVKAPTDSRVQLRDTRYKVVDTDIDEGIKKAPKRGRGGGAVLREGRVRRPFRFVLRESIRFFSPSLGKGRLFLFRDDGERVKYDGGEGGDASNVGNDGLGWRKRDENFLLSRIRVFQCDLSRAICISVALIKIISPSLALARSISTIGYVMRHLIGHDLNGAMPNIVYLIIAFTC